MSDHTGTSADDAQRRAELWEDVRTSVSSAREVLWDGCHKIYILKNMPAKSLRPIDDEEDRVISAETSTAGAMFVELRHWFEDSCLLRFISEVSEDADTGERVFTDLISQDDAMTLFN